MSWIRSSDLTPSLNPQERESLAEGRAVCRQEPDGVVVVCPRSIVTSYGLVTGCGITYGPDGEDTFYHNGGRLTILHRSVGESDVCA